MEKLDRKQEIYKVLVHPGTVKILLSLKSGAAGFTEIMFESKLSPSVLNRLLKHLVENNLVLKQNGKYVLSEQGRKLISLLEKVIEML